MADCPAVTVREVGFEESEKSDPAPASAAVCGLLEALSVMVSVALRAPEAVGLNVTLRVQLSVAARLAPQLFVCPKSPLLPPGERDTGDG